jgi:hypothetical protein
MAAVHAPTINMQNKALRIPLRHRLNMELDLQGLFGLLGTAVLIG